MQTTASELNEAISEYLYQLNKLTDDECSVKPLPNKWSKKEILGHLIDSAQNNIRRFIISQYENNPEIIYRQDDWVLINNYQSFPLIDLIQLWHLLNKQIVSILSNMPEEALHRTCKTDTLRTIEWLAKDYLKHMKRHLHQVLDLSPAAYP